MVARILIWIVKAYQLVLSPFFGQQCRFYPTCSQYAVEALQKHGAIRGSYYTVHRLLRCHPWCAGGHDPVPAQAPRLFTRLLSPLPSKKSS